MASVGSDCLPIGNIVNKYHGNLKNIVMRLVLNVKYIEKRLFGIAVRMIILFVFQTSWNNLILEVLNFAGKYSLLSSVCLCHKFKYAHL